MDRTEAPGVVTARVLAVALLLWSAAAPAAPTTFSLTNGVAAMAEFKEGTFTVRARPRFDRPDGYVALAFGEKTVARKYYLILTQTGMKMWRLDGERRTLLDTGRLDLNEGQEITLRFSILGRRYYAEVAGYPPLIADDAPAFKGRLLLRAAGARIDYDDPQVELPSHVSGS